MELVGLGVLAAKHTRNVLAEELYLHTGKDLTKPVTIHGLVNEICNYKCRYCEFWRLPNYRPEMSIDDWKKALLDLKEFRGSYHIEFSGGEPYLKHGFIELPTFCHEHGIQWGVTTNGSSFMSDKMVRATLAARPFNINISIDSKDPEMHNYSRGIENSLSRLLQGLSKVIALRKAEGLSFPIIIKPVVHRLNFRHMPAMVEFIQEIGATAINFQPVDRWTRETYDELWINSPEDFEDLAKVRDELISKKRAGAPIMNTELILNAWEKHFREQKAPVEYMPCRVGMRNYFIRPDGDVEVCFYYKPIGNVRNNNAREIWYSEEAKQRRKETVACDSLCLFTCLSQKTLADKAKMALTLVTGSRAR